MSQERRPARALPPAANPAPAGDAAPQGGNIILTREKFEQLFAAAQGAHNQSDAPGNDNQVRAAGNQPQDPTPFALSPALVNMTAPIDFTMSEGNKLNKPEVSALPFKFDVKSQSINTFNEILMDRCITPGWNGPSVDILTIYVQMSDTT